MLKIISFLVSVRHIFSFFPCNLEALVCIVRHVRMIPAFFLIPPLSLLPSTLFLPLNLDWQYSHFVIMLLNGEYLLVSACSLSADPQVATSNSNACLLQTEMFEYTNGC